MNVVDLHIHSCLSPCGSLESSPRRIASAAARKGVDIAGLSDHNTARNCPAFEAACRREGITPLYGIEVTTQEEAHVLAVFGELDAATELGEALYPLLADIPNRPDLFGDQPVVDDEEEIVEMLGKSLVGAVSLSIDALFQEVTNRGGLCIPAHIDRPMMSVYSQLGFLPDLPFHAVESTTPSPPIPIGDCTMICNSDAHYLDDIAQRFFAVPGAGFEGVRDALVRGAAVPRFSGRGSS
jgi:hypothetical protein